MMLCFEVTISEEDEKMLTAHEALEDIEHIIKDYLNRQRIKKYVVDYYEELD